MYRSVIDSLESRQRLDSELTEWFFDFLWKNHDMTAFGWVRGENIWFNDEHVKLESIYDYDRHYDLLCLHGEEGSVMLKDEIAESIVRELNERYAGQTLVIEGLRTGRPRYRLYDPDCYEEIEIHIRAVEVIKK